LYLKDLDMTHIAGEPAITRTPLTSKHQRIEVVGELGRYAEMHRGFLLAPLIQPLESPQRTHLCTRHLPSGSSRSAPAVVTSVWRPLIGDLHSPVHMSLKLLRHQSSHTVCLGREPARQVAVPMRQEAGRRSG
jgi:hypothetical protein